MKDILSLTDPVRISYIEALLKDAGIAYVLRDGHMANLFAGGCGMFPHRLAVADDDAMQARRVLENADQFHDD